jgi:hypothetical protein
MKNSKILIIPLLMFSFIISIPYDSKAETAAVSTIEESCDSEWYSDVEDCTEIYDRENPITGFF